VGVPLALHATGNCLPLAGLQQQFDVDDLCPVVQCVYQQQEGVYCIGLRGAATGRRLCPVAASQ
jgi:hypothetical protein